MILKTYTIYFTSSIKGKIKEFKEDFCTYMDRYADSVTNLMDSTGKGNAKFSDKCSAAITAGLSYTENAVDKILEAMDKANAEFQCFEDKCVITFKKSMNEAKKELAENVAATMETIKKTEGKILPKAERAAHDIIRYCGEQIEEEKAIIAKMEKDIEEFEAQ